MNQSLQAVGYTEHNDSSEYHIDPVDVCVQVPVRELGIDAALALPIVEVTSSEADGTYGVGSQISIDVR